MCSCLILIYKTMDLLVYRMISIYYPLYWHENLTLSLHLHWANPNKAFLNSRSGKTDSDMRKELHNEEESISNDAFTGNVL